MTRSLSLIVRNLAVLALSATPLPAQVARVGVAASDSARTAPAQKSPLAAGALGLVFPGAGHWYAGEGGRGVLVSAVYFTGFALVHGGRTDRVGKVAGAVTLGAWGFGIFDGAAAVRRFKRRAAATATPMPGEGRK